MGTAPSSFISWAAEVVATALKERSRNWVFPGAEVGSDKEVRKWGFGWLCLLLFLFFFHGRWLGFGIKMERFTYLESRCHARCRTNAVQDVYQFIAGGFGPLQ